MADDHPLLVERTTWRMVGASVAIVALGALVLYIASAEQVWRNHPIIQRVVEHAGALIFVTGLLHFLWELYGKRVFLDEVLAKTGVARAARSAGVTESFIDFQHGIEWPALFSHATQLDILLSYGRTWRNAHLQELRDFVAKPHARIRIILPDPDDHAVTDALAERYATTADEVRSRITEAAAEFAKLAGPEVVQIWYMRGSPMYTWYRFGHRAVISFYNHQVDRSPVPAFIVEERGIFFTFANSDFEKLLAGNRVRRVSP